MCLVRDISWFTAGIVVAVAALAGLHLYRERAEAQPSTQTEMFGIPLNRDKAELLFLKGKPFNDPASTCWTYKLSDANDNPRFKIAFTAGRVSSIEFAADGSEFSTLGLLGFRIGYSYDSVVQALGPKFVISNSQDNLERLTFFPELRAFYRFRGGRIIAFGIYEPTVDLTAFNGCT